MNEKSTEDQKVREWALLIAAIMNQGKQIKDLELELEKIENYIRGNKLKVFE